MFKEIREILIIMLAVGIFVQFINAFDAYEYDRLSKLYGYVYCDKTYGISRMYGAKDIITPPAYQRAKY